MIPCRERVNGTEVHYQLAKTNANRSLFWQRKGSNSRQQKSTDAMHLKPANKTATFVKLLKRKDID